MLNIASLPTTLRVYGLRPSGKLQGVPASGQAGPEEVSTASQSAGSKGSTSGTLQDEASCVTMLCYNVTTAEELGKERVEIKPMGPSE